MSETIVVDEVCGATVMECLNCHNEVKALQAPAVCPHCGKRSSTFTHMVIIVGNQHSWEHIRGKLTPKR